jgi:hypothetical protein
MLRARMTALVAAVLALAAIVAATRSPSAQAQAAAIRAGGSVQVVNSKNGTALLSGQLGPGDSLSGVVTIGNVGWAPGDFVLGTTGLVDTPGPGGGALSSHLQLEVDDVTVPTSPVAVYVGPLAGLSSAALGTFGVNELRTYRLTVSFPDGGSSDSQAMASSLKVTFVWMARETTPTGPPKGGGGGDPVTTDPGNPGRDRLSAPRLSLRAGKRQKVLKHRSLLIRARCDQPCTLRLSARLRMGHASKAVKLRRARWALAPGKTTRLRVRLPAAVRHRLRVQLAHHHRPLLRLQATATGTGTGGKSKTVRRSVRVVG